LILNIKLLINMIIRSPKWFRKFLDFEILIGEDVRGLYTKKTIREWDYIWSDNTENWIINKFKDFLFSRGMISDKTSPELEKFRKRYRGDMSIWDSFEKWISDEKIREEEKKRNQDRIREEIEDILDRIREDFIRYPSKHKWKYNAFTFFYYFKNGDELKFSDDKVVYTTESSIITYTIGHTTKIKFNDIFEWIYYRTKEDDYYNSYSRGGKSSGSNNKGSNTKTNDPNRERYNKLKETIRLREEQLNKMRGNDPERPPLENELNNYKLALERMRKKYSF
jgi:hypothetical protein